MTASTTFAATDIPSSRLDFAALLDHHGRLLKVETALPALALVAERLVMRDAVDRPFELELDCVSTSAHFELKRLIGEQVSVRLLLPDGGYRPWHGYVTAASQLGADGGLARYRLGVRSWLALLGLRRDSFVFQDMTAIEIVEAVFADHPQANWRVEVSDTLRVRSLCTQYRESDLDFVSRLLAEEGLAYRFEHLDGEAARDADAKGHARHALVIGDAAAERPDLGAARFTSRHVSANAAVQRDAVSAFAASRRVGPNAVALGAWDYERVAGTGAEDASALELGELPRLEHYDGAGAYRYQDAAHAARAARLALGAFELGHKRFEGHGSTRHFAAGAIFRLVDHPLYGAGAGAGAATASHARADNRFTLLAVEHHAANNLGAQAARLLGLSDVERGGCLVQFDCAPAAAPVIPRFVSKPTAPGPQSALVVGLAGEALTTEREHRVKVQFAWQRGERPNPGGLGHRTAADQSGNAPGDERSGTWVRVALPAAGANWGASFVPRIGSEVAVDFIEADIDRPIIVGQLYGGQAAPPFAAGVDSGVNHAGVISGLHSHALGAGEEGFNQWALDDATGQLRMRLLSGYAGAELGLGHLIQQGVTAGRILTLPRFM